MKKIILIFSLLLLLSCSNKIKKVPDFTEISFKEKIIGKEFLQQVAIDPNPELGGQNYIIFHTENSASVKFGDIIQIYSYKVNEISVEFNTSSAIKPLVMKIKDNENLLDEYNTIWKLKK